ncbi:MAG: D-2-hydroxyacid dehydrogenase [Clostridiales bacterium]|nr:D-2-hydroxyacid dehydrogenase [Clostridiales bacterium]
MPGNLKDIKAVLATVQYEPKHLKTMIDAFAPAPVFHFSPRDSKGIQAVLDKVDVAVLDSDLNDLILQAPGLKWIHCNHAGLAKSARPEVFIRGIILTGAAGRSAPSLSEHVFFFALSHVYDAPRLHEAQKEGDWSRFAKQFAASKGLSSKTMGIIGLGNTGRAVATRAKAFQMRALGYNRSDLNPIPEGIDEFYCKQRGDGFERLLKESDFIVLSCGLTDETYHMIGTEEFSVMKPTACLINISRGAVVDEEALLAALENNVIARAASDVFETEPLPKESPLWRLPNMMITPHATPRVADIQFSALQILLENIEHYRRGEPMKNRLTDRDVYTKA